MRAKAGGAIKSNAAPNQIMHITPSKEQARANGETNVEMLYSKGVDSPISIIAVTGTNGKTTVAKLIAHAFARIGKNVGVTTTDGIWISGELVASNETSEFILADVVLSDPTVEVAVVETMRENISKRGLGYDWSDVGIITNVQPHYIGHDGIETVEDILRIKSLVAERVRENGTLVLNADDELLARLANEPRIKKIERNIVYFSLKPSHITIKRHLSTGGTVYVLRNNFLVEATNRSETPIIEVHEIPITLNGCAAFNVANALAAAAACRAQNLTVEHVADALRTFQPEQCNAGRASLFEVDEAYVFLDYTRNPEAFRSICKMAATWNNGMRRVTGIITVPNSCNNHLIEEVGHIAASAFSRLIVRENKSLREQTSGEVAQLLSQAVKNKAPALDCRVVLDESEALRREITRLQKGDILVCFYEDFALVRSILERCDAKAVTSIHAASDDSRFGLRHA